MPTRHRHVAETLLVAAAGGALLTAISFPAGWYAGAMLFTAAAALSGRQMRLPQPLIRVCYVVLGTSLGGVATPETMAGMGAWPLSVVMVCIATVLVTIGTVTYLRRVHGWDAQTAMFAGIPGALPQVMAIATDAGADLRAIGIVQTMRVLILSVGIPGCLALLGSTSPVRRGGPLAIADAPGQFAALVGLCVVASLVLHVVRFPGGLIFGSLVASAALHGSGLVHVGIPGWFANTAMVCLGAVAGSRFTGTSFRVVAGYFGAAIGAFAVAFAIAAFFAVSIALLLSLRMADVLTAYAPGAVDVMMVLSLALHLDPVFVGAHHLARFFFVSFALPVAVRWFGATSVPTPTCGRPTSPTADGLDD